MLYATKKISHPNLMTNFTCGGSGWAMWEYALYETLRVIPVSYTFNLAQRARQANFRNVRSEAELSLQASFELLLQLQEVVHDFRNIAIAHASIDGCLKVGRGAFSNLRYCAQILDHLEEIAQIFVGIV